MGKAAMRDNKERILLSVFIPVSLTILFLLAGSVVAVYLFQQRNADRDVLVRVDAVKRLFENRLKQDATLLSAIVDFVGQDKMLQDSFEAADREKLLGYAAPLFEQLHPNYRVTHFYFHGPDKICFLRVHKPESYGDYIERFTLDKAAKTGKTAWGIELGPYGTFTLRVVHPWHIDGKVAGYIELGEEIGHITPEVREIVGVEIAFLIDKSLLNRTEWEEGLRMTGRTGDWDMLEGYVVEAATVDAIPWRAISGSKLTDRHMGTLLDVPVGAKKYRAGVIDLHDAAGRAVGGILAMKNVTQDKAALRALVGVMTGLCCAAGAVSLGLLYIYIGRIEQRLRSTRAALEREIERRELTENELLKHRENLEKLVGERTRELRDTNEQLGQEVLQRVKTERELEKANKDLQSAVAQLMCSNKQLRDIVHAAAHDLKTPLRGIATLAQWLVSDCANQLDHHAKEQIEMLVSRVKHLDKLTDAIVEYVTTVRGKGNERAVDLNGVVAQVLDEIQAPETVKIRVQGRLPVITCEAKHIHTVFYHLLANAVRFMDKPKGCIDITCAEQNQDYEFRVSDNGPGIEQRHFERIFEIFQTLCPNDKYENTGVGLTLVKNIVEMYGGKIWLESEVGKGTTFFFTLPKAPVGPEQAVAATAGTVAT